MTLKYSQASGECLSPEILILKRNGQSDLFFYPSEAMQHNSEKSSSMKSSSAYAEATTDGTVGAPAARQHSYYEAVRNVVPPTDGINIASCASTAQLVDEVTCPKEFYQVKPLQHVQNHHHNHRAHPPIPEENQRNPREVFKNSKIISRGAYLLLVAICLVSVCLAIFCSIMTINMQKQVDDLEKKFGQRGAISSAHGATPPSVLCLPCDDIKQGPFPDDNQAFVSLDVQTVNGTEICCAQSPEQLSILFDLFAKRKLGEKCTEGSSQSCNTTSGTPSPMPPIPKKTISAHLQIGRQISEDSNQNIAQPIRNWLSDRATTHLEGVQIRNDRIVIPESGLYFVYSQAGFLIYYDANQAVTAFEQSLFHYVNRYNSRLPNGGVQELMRSDMSQCWEQNKSYSRYTSYIGATIQLQQNDELFVKVSNFASLQAEPSLTFFGMFKID